MKVNPRIVVGISALNEERTIAKVVIRASKYADAVLVVDDGSSDDTGLIAEKLGAVVRRHDRNLGKGAGLRACLDWARSIGAEVLVTLDADGQHDPDEIPMIIDPILNEKVDIAIGSRRMADNAPGYRRFGARVLDYATGVKVSGSVVDAQSGFRAYSKKALETLIATESGMGVDSEILMRAKDANLGIVEVPIKVSYKGMRSSEHNPVYHALDVFFSVLKFTSIRNPLLFYGGFSAIMFIIATAFGIQTLEYYAKWNRVVTNLALVSVAAGILGFVSLFTGVILFTLITVIREKK